MEFYAVFGIYIYSEGSLAKILSDYEDPAFFALSRRDHHKLYNILVWVNK